MGGSQSEIPKSLGALKAVITEHEVLLLFQRDSSFSAISLIKASNAWWHQMARDDAYHVIGKGEQECPSDILLKAISQTKKKKS